MDESVIARLAGTQRGVVTAGQLQAAGFDRAAIKRRCRAGRLHRLHRGVYLVGHAIAPEGAREVAALLACGPGSVLSHHSAARLWGLPLPCDGDAPVEITVVRRDPGHRPGIRIHRSRTLRRPDVRRVDGIPATSPGRTLLDLASTLEPDDLEVAFAQARGRRLVRARDLMAVLERNPGARGAKVLRRLIDLYQGPGLTRSEAERRMLALVRAAALPIPKVNERVGRFHVDFLWPTEKVVVEVDGYAFHSDAQAFERDRERDAVLVGRGYVVLRVTWRQLMARREAVAARVAAALCVRA